MASPIAPYGSNNLQSGTGDRAGGEAEIFALNTSDLKVLRGELARDTKDFQLYPYGPALSGGLDEQEGIVTPDMFDAVLNAAAFDLEMGYPGSGSVYGFSLYTPYRELERDTKISAALQTRIMNSVQRDWLVTPASDDALDIKAADMVRSHFEALETHAQDLGELALLDDMSGVEQMQAQFLDALLMGFAAGEIIWDKDGREKFPRQIKPKGQHRWAMYLSEKGWEPRLLTRSDRTLGVPVPARKFLFYRHRPQRGPFGMGLGHELYFPTSYKRRTLELFLIHGQRYASPTAFITVPPNAPDEVVEAARAAVSEIGVEAGITIPQGATVIPFEGKVGNNSTYEKLLDYLDGQASQVILGQTGTLDQSGDSGSRAQDQVADLQTVRLAKQDTDAWCAYLGRTLVSWDVNENLPGARPPKISRPFPELEKSENELEKAQRDEKIVLFTGRRIKREFTEARHDVELEDELISSSTPNPVSKSSDNLQGSANLEQGAELSEQPGKSQASNSQAQNLTGSYREILNNLCGAAPINLAATPVGEEDEWAALALDELMPVLKDFQAAVKAAVDTSETPKDLDKTFLSMLRSQIIRQRMSRAIAPALSVAMGVGMLDVEEELREGDRTVGLAEGFSPVMGFTAAIEAMAAKIPVPTKTWRDLQGADQAWAFTIAGIMQADVLSDMQAAVQKSIEGGSSFKAFKDSFDQAYARTGLAPLAPWRARLVLNQNVKNSYQAGRYARQEDPEYQRVAPYRKYAHGFSDTPRPSHIALDGFVARADDAVWDSIYPPNGFNCSCRVFSLTQGQFERGGYSLSDPLPGGDGSSPLVELPSGAVVPVADEGFGGAPVATRTRVDAIALAKMRLPADKWGALGIKEPEKVDSLDDDLLGGDGLDDPFVDDGLGSIFDGLLAISDEGVTGEAALPDESFTDVPEPEIARGKVSTKTWQEHTAKARKVYAKEFAALEKIKGVDAKLLDKLAAAEENLRAKPNQQSAKVRARNAKEAIAKAKAKAIADREKVCEELRAKILARGDRAAAKAWAKSIKIERDALPVYQKKDLYRILEEFHLVSKGKAENLRSLNYRDFVRNGKVIIPKERAFAERRDGSINIGDHKDFEGNLDKERLAKVLFHEMGHHVEFGPNPAGAVRYGDAASTWRDARVSSTEQSLLSDLTGDARYQDFEKARPGEFYDPYLGKVYNDNTTEVLAMGIEHFASADTMAQLWNKQPDLFDFALGVLEDDD